jgi:Acetyl-CoA hydrolase
MSFYDDYKKKLTTPENAVKMVNDGDWVDYNFGYGMPQLLDDALAKRKGELKDVKVRAYLAMNKIQIVEQDPERESFTYFSWFCSGIERKYSDAGLCVFAPMTFRNLPSYYDRGYAKVDVAMLCVTPMDNHGYFNVSGVNAACRSMLNAADKIILEVNENLPWVYGGEGDVVHISEVDAVVEGPHGPLGQLKSPEPSETDEKIASYIMKEMVDGATLQLGIGGLPYAVGRNIARSDLKDLGMHTEMMGDSFVDMIEAGKITNSRKRLNKGKGVFGCALGTQRLFDFIDRNPVCVSYPINYVNSPAVMAQIDNMITVNGCIAVDLFGQTCAESAGTRHISGSGGQLDFLTGAYDSPGGKNFICMTSSFVDKKGVKHSRFVPTFNGDIVTDPRSQAFYLATEYGIINLAGKTNWERTEMMISIADPDFREELIKDAEKLGIWTKSNKR